MFKVQGWFYQVIPCRSIVRRAKKAEIKIAYCIVLIGIQLRTRNREPEINPCYALLVTRYCFCWMLKVEGGVRYLEKDLRLIM